MLTFMVTHCKSRSSRLRRQWHSECKLRGPVHCAGTDASLGAWVRRVAAQVADTSLKLMPALEQKQTSPVAEAASACPAPQQAADTGDEALKQKRPRAKAKPRKSAKRTRTAAADDTADRRGTLRVPTQTHHLVCGPSTATRAHGEYQVAMAMPHDESAHGVVPDMMQRLAKVLSQTCQEELTPAGNQEQRYNKKPATLSLLATHRTTHHGCETCDPRGSACRVAAGCLLDIVVPRLRTARTSAIFAYRWAPS